MEKLRSNNSILIPVEPIHESGRYLFSDGNFYCVKVENNKIVTDFDTKNPF